MRAYVLRRAIYVSPMLIVASALAFYALRIAPGSPVSSILSPLATAQQKTALARRLGLLHPIWQQYFIWVGHVVRGDLGRSLIDGQSIANLIGTYGARTALLGVSALSLTYVVAIPLGVMAALKRGSVADKLAMMLANFGMGMPSFWLGLLLILLFSLTLNLLPAQGSGGVTHLIMPAVVLAAEGIAITMRLMRSTTLGQLNREYVRTLQAKGLPRRRIVWLHVLRNSLTPVVALAGIRIGWLIGYTLIVESVFSWPGMGYLLVNSVINRDYPVAQALAVLLTLFVFISNYAADICAVALDPRLRTSDAAVR